MGANSGTRFRLVTASGTQESYGASVDTHEARFDDRRGGINSDEKGYPPDGVAECTEMEGHHG